MERAHSEIIDQILTPEFKAELFATFSYAYTMRQLEREASIERNARAEALLDLVEEDETSQLCELSARELIYGALWD